jgi:hypothetical protein
MNPFLIIAGIIIKNSARVLGMMAAAAARIYVKFTTKAATRVGLFARAKAVIASIPSEAKMAIGVTLAGAGLSGVLSTDHTEATVPDNNTLARLLLTIAGKGIPPNLIITPDVLEQAHDPELQAIFDKAMMMYTSYIEQHSSEGATAPAGVSSTAGNIRLIRNVAASFGLHTELALVDLHTNLAAFTAMSPSDIVEAFAVMQSAGARL